MFPWMRPAALKAHWRSNKMAKRELQRKIFLLDAEEDTGFEGFTDGQTWNGWACPYFDFEAAIRVLNASEKNGYRWHFDEEENVFLIRHVEDADDFEPEQVNAVIISFEGVELTVYPVGAYSWAWQTAS